MEIENRYFEHLPKEEQDKILKELEDVYESVRNWKCKCFENRETCDFCNREDLEYVDRTEDGRKICLDCSGDPKGIMRDIFKNLSTMTKEELDVLKYKPVPIKAEERDFSQWKN